MTSSNRERRLKLDELKVHRDFVQSFHKLTILEQSRVLRIVRAYEGGAFTPGMRLHHVGPYISLSPDMDIRIIALGPLASPTFLYVDHHDAAYAWAERRRPIQLVDGVELLPIELLAVVGQEYDSTRVEILAPLPLERLADLAINEEQLLEWIVDLSPEWQEWMFQVFVEHQSPRPPLPSSSSLVYCPTNDLPLSEALQLSMPSWRLFLHPKQLDITLANSYSTIAVSGGPGTGKTSALINRFLSLPQEPNTRRILFTYSQNLCSYLIRQIEDAAGGLPKAKVVYPLHFLGGHAPETYQGVRPKHITLEVVDGQLWQGNSQTGEHYPVEEILVDEFQDADEFAISILSQLRQAGRTRVVVAADISQTIHRANFEFVQQFLDECDITYPLSYCYRSSRQIIDCTNQIMASLNDQIQLQSGLSLSTKMEFALSGLRVVVHRCSDLRTQVAACKDILTDLEGRYPSEGLALIYLQYFNPAFKGPSPEEAALKNHPKLGKYYVFSSLSKGKEYLAGVVFISKTFLAKQMGPSANQLRANTLLVALTRFRDELTIVYPEGCEIEEALSAVSIIKQV